jgi:hypothetical protein
MKETTGKTRKHDFKAPFVAGLGMQAVEQSF